MRPPSASGLSRLIRISGVEGWGMIQILPLSSCIQVVDDYIEFVNYGQGK